jgi:3-methylcrotonyl-CoA carboxylase alpha subunit
MHALVWAKDKERYAALEQSGQRLSYAIFGLGDRLQSAQAHSGELRAPMPGRVVLLKARAGERVQKGDVLLVMEAMKMEHSIVAPKDGVIESCLCKVGDQIQEGADLITFEA